jgi:hypothetical protein
MGKFCIRIRAREIEREREKDAFVGSTLTNGHYLVYFW